MSIQRALFSIDIPTYHPSAEDSFFKVPMELIQYIFQWLPTDDLFNCKKVNREWRQIIRDPLTFKKKFFMQMEEKDKSDDDVIEWLSKIADGAYTPYENTYGDYSILFGNCFVFQEYVGKISAVDFKHPAQLISLDSFLNNSIIRNSSTRIFNESSLFFSKITMTEEEDMTTQVNVIDFRSRIPSSNFNSLHLSNTIEGSITAIACEGKSVCIISSKGKMIHWDLDKNVIENFYDTPMRDDINEEITLDQSTLCYSQCIEDDKSRLLVWDVNNAIRAPDESGIRGPRVRSFDAIIATKVRGDFIFLETKFDKKDGICDVTMLRRSNLGHFKSFRSHKNGFELMLNRYLVVSLTTTTTITDLKDPSNNRILQGKPFDTCRIGFSKSRSLLFGITPNTDFYLINYELGTTKKILSGNFLDEFFYGNDILACKNSTSVKIWDRAIPISKSSKDS